MHIRAHEDCTEPIRSDILRICSGESQIDIELPSRIYVSSTSKIKLATVADVLRIISPSKDYELTGFKAPSGVPEQPIGQQAIDGALNRLRNTAKATKEDSDSIAIISIENGLFRSPRVQAASLNTVSIGDSLVYLNGVDLTTDFDPDAEYGDRTVAAISLPSRPTVVQLSTNDEAVMLPKAAIHDSYSAEGGFEKNTAGSILYETGLITDKQNPHIDLTANYPQGAFSRQEQMARAVIRAIITLSQEAS